MVPAFQGRKRLGAGGGVNKAVQTFCAWLESGGGSVMSKFQGRMQESAGSRRHRMLRMELRGIYEPADLRGFERDVSDVVRKVMDRAGLGERLAEETVSREWEGMVGAFLAGQSRPVGLRSGVLQVAVLQSSVRYDLERNHKRDILRRLQERFGRQVVKDVRFMPG